MYWIKIFIYFSFIMSVVFLLQRGITYGEDIDFSTIASSVMETGDFTAAEKFLMTGEENDLEMRLWAIYLTVSRPIY